MEEHNDYQYFCVLIGGGFFYTDLPVLVLPGSYIYMGHNGTKKRFYVAEYRQPEDELGDYDIAVYCEEVPNTVNMKQIRRDLKINNILNK